MGFRRLAFLAGTQPKMMQTAIELGVQLANGDWVYEVGSGSYEPVFIVDRTNAAEVEGFQGH